MSLLSMYKDKYKELISVPVLKEIIDKAQEVHYRIFILEELKMLSDMLSVLSSDEDVKKHFSRFMKLLTRMEKEFYSTSEDTVIQNKRNQSRCSFSDVITDFRNRMMGMSYIAAIQYADMVKNGLNAIIPAWIVYRDTLTEIKIDL